MMIDLTGLGSRQLMGDIDYFPNNGDIQPACNREPIEILRTEGPISGL